MNPLGAAIICLLVWWVLAAPRLSAALGMVAGVLFLTQDVQVHLGGINMFASRFLELAGFVRVLSRGEFSFSRLSRVDRLFLWFNAYTVGAYLLRGGSEPFSIIGGAVDYVFTYFAFRGLIRNVEDLRWILLRTLALLLPYVAIVLVESYSRFNLFSLLGGGSEVWEREGRVRCIGSFRYASLLGTFGAVMAPMYFAMVLDRGTRWAGWAGVALSVLIVWLSNSGGPMMALGAAVAGWCLWSFRKQMKAVRWSLVALLVLLTLVMAAPVWYVFDRLSSIVGGDGWHRSYLIDVSLKHLDTWWLAGVPMVGTSDWFPYTLEATGGADITNQFILFGVTSGVAAIVLFVILLVRSFISLGKALETARTFGLGDGATEYHLWGLGVALAAHIVNWFGVPYFDQIYVIWLMQMAAITSLTLAIFNEFPPVGAAVAGSYEPNAGAVADNSSI